jgi:hypothetical protein
VESSFGVLNFFQIMTILSMENQGKMGIYSNGKLPELSDTD